MIVSSAMLADAAHVSEAKLYIHGGAWDSITASSLPVVQPSMALVLIFQLEWDEALDPQPFTIALWDEDNQPAGFRAEGSVSAGHPPGASRGAPLTVPQQLTLGGLKFERAG